MNFVIKTIKIVISALLKKRHGKRNNVLENVGQLVITKEEGQGET